MVGSITCPLLLSKAGKENISVESSAGVIVLRTPPWTLQLHWIFLSVAVLSQELCQTSINVLSATTLRQEPLLMGKMGALYDGAAVMAHRKCPVCIPAMMVPDSPSHNCTPVERAIQGEKLCRIMDDLQASWGCSYRRLTSGCRFGAIFKLIWIQI